MDLRVAPERMLSTEELMILNCSVGEDSWESLNHRVKPVSPKGNQSWISIGRTDAKAESPILWPPDAKSWLIGKDPGAEKNWRQKRQGQQRMRWVRQPQRLSGHERLQQRVEDRGAWRATVHGATESDTGYWLTESKPDTWPCLSNWTVPLLKV